jgi:uncharacterized protein (DUF1015 family)
MASTYPTGVQVFIDDEDVTKWIFGVDEIELNDVENSFRNIDLSPYCSAPGEHRLTISCATGVGRVEARIEVE